MGLSVFVVRKRLRLYLLLVTVMAFVSLAANGQSTFNDVAMDCDRATVKAMDAIPILYKHNKIDSLSTLLNRWEQSCGLTEPIFSLRVLMAIEDDSMGHYLQSLQPAGSTAADSMLLKNVYHYLVAYRSARELYAKVKKKDNESVQDCEDYYTMLRTMARKLTGKPRVTPLEDFITRWYAGREGAEYYFTPKSNAPKKKYESGMVAGAQFFLTGGYAAGAGGYAATGNHAAIGGLMGGKLNEWIINLDFGYLAPATPANMMRRNHDTDYQITSTSGGWCGLEIGYDVWRHTASELDILGFGGYTTLSAKQSKYLAGSTWQENTGGLPEMVAPDFAVGIGYKYYFRHLTEKTFLKHMFASMQVKYDFISFKNPGGTDIKGGTFNIRMVLGINGYENGIPVDD